VNYLVLQGEVKTYGEMLERFGLPILFLVVVGLFIWKLLWPLIIKAMAALEDQIKEARQARKEDTDRFLQALSDRDRVNEGQTRAIENLTRQIDEIRDWGKR
jgi:hypothetical protein